MLNRRILRTKVFKAVYSIAENPSVPVRESVESLRKSCESTRDLYVFLLDLTIQLRDQAYNYIEAARSKFNPTEEERNPNMKFVENLISVKMQESPDFRKILSKRHLDCWDRYDIFLRHLLDSLLQEQFFKDYMSEPSADLKADAKLFRNIYETLLEDNEELVPILEELSIWWNDDLGYALTWCCKTMDYLGKGSDWGLPPLYASQLPGNEAMSSDEDYVLGVLRTAHRNFEKYTDSIAALTPKWDRSRICTTDLALIVSGQAEADAFPQTPRKVIINEYVEIAKFYSTPDSRAFVNGLLDKLINNKD